MYNLLMLSFLTLICLFSAIAFPTLMLCIVYPFSRKAALFWSNYITVHTDRVVFAILRYYRHFNYLPDKKSMRGLPGQFLVISNHQSLLDIVLYLRYFGGLRTRFVAKDSLEMVPMVGKMLKSQQHCMIPRKGAPSVAMRELEKFGNRVVERNQIPVIFPEGTRSRDGNLSAFYAAGFRRLEETIRLPVVVCAIDGGWRLSHIRTIMQNLKRGAYRVKVLKVYPAPRSKEEEKHILEESRTLIQGQLDAWRALPAGSLEI